MKAHWWCCVLGLLCVPAGVMLRTVTVSQDPTSISLTRVNSSAEITCSTSLSEPMSLALYGRFPDKYRILFLSVKRGQVTQQMSAPQFEGRIRVAPHQRIGAAHGFTLQLSLLGPGDTNLYYCLWEFFKLEMSSSEALPSPGTVIIVREASGNAESRW